MTRVPLWYGHNSPCRLLPSRSSRPRLTDEAAGAPTSTALSRNPSGTRSPYAKGSAGGGGRSGTSGSGRLLSPATLPPPGLVPSPGPTVALRIARRSVPFPGRTALAPQTRFAKRTGGSTPRFRQNRLAAVLHDLSPGARACASGGLPPGMRGLQPLARLVHNLYVVE